MTDQKRVLILCTGNSARSQMAEGMLRSLAQGRLEVKSAGVAPTQVRPEAVEVMREIGLDISQHRSKSVEELADQHFDFVITVCDHAQQECPVFPGQCERIHWGLEDPAIVVGDEDARLQAFRKTREELRSRLKEFVSEVLEANENGPDQ